MALRHVLQLGDLDAQYAPLTIEPYHALLLTTAEHDPSSVHSIWPQAELFVHPDACDEVDQPAGVGLLADLG